MYWWKGSCKPWSRVAKHLRMMGDHWAIEWLPFYSPIIPLLTQLLVLLLVSWCANVTHSYGSNPTQHSEGLQLAQPMAIEKSLWSASYNCRWWASGSQYVHDFYLSVTYCVYKLKLPHMLGTQLHFCMKYGSCTKATYTYEWIASYFFTPFPSCSLVTLIYIYILLSCDIVIRQEIASIT